MQAVLARKNDRKTQCSGNFFRSMGIPCSHRIFELIKKNTQLKITDFHSRWLFIPLYRLKNPTIMQSTDTNSPLDFAINQLRNMAKTEAQQQSLASFLLDVSANSSSIIYNPAVKLDGKGRPTQLAKQK